MPAQPGVEMHQRGIDVCESGGEAKCRRVAVGCCRRILEAINPAQPHETGVCGMGL
jgi:hypothetical protein